MDKAALMALAERHMKAFCTGDLATVMADYAQNARIVTSMGVVEGHDAIRAMFAQNLSGGFFEKGVAVTTYEPPVVVDENAAVVYWKTVNGDQRTAGGVDVFLIRDGKISFQVASGELVPQQS